MYATIFITGQGVLFGYLLSRAGYSVVDAPYEALPLILGNVALMLASLICFKAGI